MPNNPNSKQTEDTSRFGTIYAPVEELEAEDKKAIEASYVNSYSYTKSQRIAGLIAVVIVLGLVIWGVVTLFMSIINLINA
jgi:hypothetical protein